MGLREDWEEGDARSIVLNVRDSEDAYDYRTDEFNLKKGIWVVFSNSEAEDSILEELGSIYSLESRARDMGFHYRDYPRYIEAVLDNCKFRRYETEWRLVEVEGDE